MTRDLASPGEAVNRAAMIAALLAVLMYGTAGDYEQPDPMHLLALIGGVVGVAGVLARQRWAGTYTLLLILIVALREHAIQGDHRASDSMLVTNEAVGVLLNGIDPYTHVMAMTNPPGGGIGYPSGEIVFYTLWHLAGVDIFRVDLICGILTLGLIGSLAPFCGPGLAALGIALIGWADFVTFRLTDGSNDNAVLSLVVAGFCALVWSRHSTGRFATVLWWTSAVAFGWALAFKEYALPVVLFVSLFLWRIDAARTRRWLAGVLGTIVVMLLPFFLWNPIVFVRKIFFEPLYHTNFWGRNVWHDFVHPLMPSDALGPFVPVIVMLAVAGLCVFLWRHPARNIGSALFQGALVVTTIFVLTRWTTSTYYIYLAPLVIIGAIMSLGEEYAVETTVD